MSTVNGALRAKSEAHPRLARLPRAPKAAKVAITPTTYDHAISQAVRLGLADAVQGKPPRRTWRMLAALGLAITIAPEIVDALRAAYMGARKVAPTGL